MNFIENESLAMQELLENYWEIISKPYNEVFRVEKQGN
jgi:hypothetical protein